MLILHVVPSLNEGNGGPLRLVLDLSARAALKGLRGEVVGVGDVAIQDNPLDPSLVHAIPGSPIGPWAYAPALRGWLRRNLQRFDGVVIHGAWLYPGWAAARECRRAGLRYAYYPHGMLEQWAVSGQGRIKELKKRAYWTIGEKCVVEGSCCVLFTTLRERALTKSTVPIGPRDLLLPPYGIESESEREVEPLDSTLKQPEGRRVALFLGRLHRKKNPDLLIEAWRLAGPPKGWKLVIAGSGDGAFEGILKRLAQEHALHESIQFTGFVAGQDKRYLLSRADWFLLPSSQENFGIAVLEAVQYGCAVAISDQVYLADSFPGASEILPVSTEAWVKFFQNRMVDEEWRNRTGQEVRAHLMVQFNFDTIVSRWVETFARLFNRSDSRAA